MICLIGGARSGKSSLAQQLAKDAVASRRLDGVGSDGVLTVTFGKTGCDDEFDSRIEHHRRNRPADWQVVELGNEPTDHWEHILSVIPQPDFAVTLIDCISTLVSCLIDDALNGLYQDKGAHCELIEDGMVETITSRAEATLARLSSLAPKTIFVTNEVGSAPVAPSAAGRLFVDSLGWVNQSLVALCDKTYFVVAGLPLEVSSLPGEATWD